MRARVTVVFKSSVSVPGGAAVQMVAAPLTLAVCTPSMACAALVACTPVIVAPPAASARFVPASSSSVVAATSMSDRPEPETRKIAVSLTALVSAAAPSVTVWNTFQFQGRKVREAPLLMVRLVLPQARDTLIVRFPELRKRIWNRPSPASRTHSVCALNSGVGWLQATWQEWTTGSAASQFADPACVATMETVPVPRNHRLVSSTMTPGPDSTAKDTGRPLEAVAASRTTLVAH